MNIKNVTVVFKKSSYELYGKVRRDKNFLRLLSDKDPIVKRFIPSHEIHRHSLEALEKLLLRKGICAAYVYRAKEFSEKNADLILTLGGDGTFLEASHSVQKVPILGINSNPADSVGMFCGKTVGELDEFLDRMMADLEKPMQMSRLTAKLGNDKPVRPILNDILIANSNPAATSRIIVEVAGVREELKCSGMWIAPAAGSTAGIRSAGGDVLPLRSKKFQIVVREPYILPGSSYKLLRKTLPPESKVVVYSKMRTGGIFFDGSHKQHPFSLGQKVVITNDAPPLQVFGFNEKRRKLFE